MSTKNLPLLLVPFILAGCINLENLSLDFKIPVSLHPLFTDKEVIFDQRLLGDWKTEDPNNIVRFNKTCVNSYEIFLIEHGEKTVMAFESHTLKLDNKLYLDISPATIDANGNNPLNPLLLPTHIFAKIKSIEPNLQVQLLLIPESLEKDPNFLKHETTDTLMILTASTKELQDFVKAHADDEALFRNTLVLERLKPNNMVDHNNTDQNKLREK